MNKALIARLEACTQLPSPPTVAMEIVRLCQSDELDMRALTTSLSKDPVIAAKVLRTANSAMFGTRSEVTTLGRAVSMLGANTVMTLSLSFSLVTSKTKETGGFDYRRFWRRSLLSAVAARTVGARLGKSPDELFLAGLFQDLGMLVLDAAIDEYAAIARDASGDHVQLVALERALLATDHAEAGAWLAERWGLPAPMVNLVRASHDPAMSRAADRVVAGCVAMSGLIADVWLNTDRDAAVGVIAEHAQPWLGIPAAHASDVLSDVAGEIPQYAAIFEMPLVDSGALAAVLQEAHEALVNVSLRVLQLAQQTEATVVSLTQEKNELEARAQRDALTGLYSRAYFERALHTALEVARRYNGTLSVFFCDIDFFKKINDTYGHAIGDRVLAGIARVFGGSLRQIDVAARYGGEEFVAILPATDAEGASHVAERIRASVEAAVLTDDAQRPIPVTVSIGVATHGSGWDAGHVAELLAAADKSLYEAKHAGRNRVVTHAPEPR